MGPGSLRVQDDTYVEQSSTALSPDPEIPGRFLLRGPAFTGMPRRSAIALGKGTLASFGGC